MGVGRRDRNWKIITWCCHKMTVLSLLIRCLKLSLPGAFPLLPWRHCPWLSPDLTSCNKQVYFSWPLTPSLSPVSLGSRLWGLVSVLFSSCHWSGWKISRTPTLLPKDHSWVLYSGRTGWFLPSSNAYLPKQLVSSLAFLIPGQESFTLSCQSNLAVSLRGLFGTCPLGLEVRVRYPSPQPLSSWDRVELKIH